MQKKQFASFGQTPADYSSIMQVHQSKGSILTDPHLKAATKLDAETDSAQKVGVQQSKVLSLKTIRPSLVVMEYGVRGGILDYFKELQRRMKLHPEKYDFHQILEGNLGNPQAVGSVPITFCRQVLACLAYPPLAYPKGPGVFRAQPTLGTLEEESSAFESRPTHLETVFPKDVCALAQEYLKDLTSLGAYSMSEGLLFCRQSVANFIGRRDGYPCDPNSILLTDGATPAIKMILETLISTENDGVMIPVPQYPLYSAAIVRLGGKVIPYYLDEENGWNLDLNELTRAHNQFKAENPNGVVKCLVVINPGNPTGALIPHQDLDAIINFCHVNKLLLIADEVYQSLIFDDSVGFKSLRQCLYEQNSTVEVASFHTVSKTLGECGIRGGYMQLENISPEVVAVISKCLSVTLCANTLGQCLCALMTHEMDKNGESYPQYEAEVSDMIKTLKFKAEAAYECFNGVPGISCQRVGGGMYAFPKITLPQKAIEFAKYLNIEADLLYCAEMVQTLGLLCVPGSAFLQKEGTYHFRITVLPETQAYLRLLKQLKDFHLNFVKHYS